MTVFLLFHSSCGDPGYLRGVYASANAAKRAQEHAVAIQAELLCYGPDAVKVANDPLFQGEVRTVEIGHDTFSISARSVRQ